MSHFSNWKVSQVSKNLMSYDNVRVSCERKKWNKKQEDLPKEQPSPHGPMLQKRKGAQIIEDKSKETGDDKTAEEGPSLGKTDPRKDTKDWKLPMALGPVYPPSISSLSTTKAVGQSWEFSPPTAKSFRIHDEHVACLPQQGPFRHFMDMKAEKRLAGWKERRSRYGDINVHKRYQFGQIFSPFQALATTSHQCPHKIILHATDGSPLGFSFNTDTRSASFDVGAFLMLLQSITTASRCFEMSFI
ncbi:uncharacterized protein [Equus przewalskii]|uniref:Uncharacterized protein isoform X2 n=1 Tax=Equus przewalskii TaxID=9798 RepID=A0ABM4JNV6_EQUPR